MTNLSIHAVTDAVRTLTASGWLRVARTHGKGNQYTVLDPTSPAPGRSESEPGSSDSERPGSSESEHEQEELLEQEPGTKDLRADEPRAHPPSNPPEPTAQTIVADWIDWNPAPPPRRIVGQVAKQVRELLIDRATPTEIAVALHDMDDRGLHPSTLPSLVHANRSRRPTATRLDSKLEQVRRSGEIAQQMEAGGMSPWGQSAIGSGQ